MSKHPWTYKIVLEYHACTWCGYIIESREEYHMREGVFIKELTCPRCHRLSVVERRQPGPLEPY